MCRIKRSQCIRNGLKSFQKENKRKNVDETPTKSCRTSVLLSSFGLLDAWLPTTTKFTGKTRATMPRCVCQMHSFNDRTKHQRKKSFFRSKIHSFFSHFICCRRASVFVCGRPYRNRCGFTSTYKPRPLRIHYVDHEITRETNELRSKSRHSS